MDDPAVAEKGRVAVYWDFENVVLSRFDAVHGRSAWSQARYDPRRAADGARARMGAARVEMRLVLEYAKTLGAVVINRAYADWTPWWMSDYKDDLLREAVDLVQLFPLSKTKNGADIRLAVDVVDDLHRHHDLTDIVVVAGDSDYVGLAQRCRRNGRRFVGVGVQGSTSKHLVAASDVFKFYELLGQVESPAPDEEAAARDPEDGRQLLVRALNELLNTSSDGWVIRAQLGKVLRRLDPSFDHRDYGHVSFTQFLDAYEPDVVEHRDHPGGDREYRLTATSRPTPPLPASAELELVVPTGTADAPASVAVRTSGPVEAPPSSYAADLRATRIPLEIDRGKFWTALDELPRLLGATLFPTARELQRALAEHMHADTAREVAVTAFRVGRLLRWTDTGYRFRQELSSHDVRHEVALGYADRLRQSHGHRLDEDLFVTLLFGMSPTPDDRSLARWALDTPSVHSYHPLLTDVLPGGALLALLDALASAPRPALGSPSDVRALLVGAAEGAGFALTESEGEPVWNLLYDAGILGNDASGNVHRLPPGVRSVLVESLVQTLSRRITDEGVPLDSRVLAAATGLPVAVGAG